MLSVRHPRRYVSAGGVAITLLWLTASAVHAQNLLQNGRFEEGPRPDCPNIANHWEAVEDGCVGFIQALDSTTKHSGVFSQRLGSSTDTDLGWLRQVTDYNSVQEGKTYRLTAWIKSTVTDGWGWNLLYVQPFVDDIGGAHMNMPQQDTPNFDWRLIAMEYTIPVGSGINRIGVALTRHWQNGSAWYDDIVLAEVSTEPPEITVSPTSITHEVIRGQPLADEAFTVQNTGGQTLTYTVSESADWLSLSPTNGSSIGEADAITIHYDVLDLQIDTYTTTITLVANGATNSPLALPITLHVVLTPIPADIDRDRDVDQEDFGLFQACLTGPGIVQDDPDCARTRLDIDSDVDGNDFILFQKCFTGPDIEGDPGCLD